MAETPGFILLLLVLSEKMTWSSSKVVLPDVNVTCIVHDDCILPCSFRPTGTVVIHWYKQQIPVHSYYYHKDQFGLQNKHFSGRTSLFNSHIPQGNASLLLRRVKIQDRGRYKCYTSTRKGNQEMFVNMELKAPIQSVIMEINDQTATCTSHNIYPMPQVTWATEPTSDQGALENSTIRTTDHKGLFTVESTLRIVGNPSNLTYFCSFVSADKTQTWTASRKNQAPHNLQNFSLTWTFSSSGEPSLILRYDNRTRHTVNLWEGHAELDQDLLLQGDGSLLLNKPDSEDHSGTYICTFSDSQSRHIVQTKVNITVASMSLDKKSTKRSWWSTAASAAFVLFTIIMALPQCVRRRETGTPSHRHNGTGLHKGLNPSGSFMMEQHGIEGSSPPEARDEQADSTEETTEKRDDASEPDQEAEEEPDEGRNGPLSRHLEGAG
uniref:HERV-H LTR-associating 2 n=1 Tax=Nothobranchius furzeri TaxID=105023 RepID=A0A1A8UZN6_NOTFU